MMKKNPMTEEEFSRANEKSRKRKEARDRILADKTVEKGLLIIQTKLLFLFHSEIDLSEILNISSHHQLSLQMILF